MKHLTVTTLLSLALLMFAATGFSQNLVIKFNSGNESGYPLNDFRKITYSSGLDTLVVHTQSGTSQSQALSEIRHLRFGEYCYSPSSIWTSRIAPTTARLNWTPNPEADGYKIRGRGVGLTNWTYLTITGGASSFVNVSGLSPGATLEWQIQSLCNGGALEGYWTELTTFTTGCYAPDSLWNELVTHNAARFNWERGWGTFGYEIRGRVFGFTGGTNLLVGGGTTTSKDVFGLNPNTTYEWRIRSLCNSTGTYFSAWSPWITFTTAAGPKLEGVTDPFSETEAMQEWAIWPQPAGQELNMTFNNPEGNPAIITLYDLAGRKAASWQTHSNRLTISTGKLPAGVYVGELTLNGARQNQRVVLQ